MARWGWKRVACGERKVGLGRAVAFGWILSWLAVGGGCADLIGARRREFDGSDGDAGAGVGGGSSGGGGSDSGGNGSGGAGVEDEETGITTTQACVGYCDTVLENCTGGNSVYTSRDTCISVCNALEPGDANEPIGNTLACRHDHARSAERFPEEFCPASGPAAGDACGDDCEAWCQLLSVICPDEFDVLSDCESACPALATDPPYTSAKSSGETLQCRFYHVSAASVDAATHCTHAQFVSTGFCIDEATEDGEPSCESYCRNTEGACPGELATYESRAQCLATCAALADINVGQLSDRSALSVGCRQYHSEAALVGPTVHCRHTGPGGDGTCTQTASEGNCEAYCALLAPACGAGVLDDLGGEGELCEATCRAAFAGNGAQQNSNYSVGAALEEGGLKCRLLMISRALDGDEEACSHVRPNDDCP